MTGTRYHLSCIMCGKSWWSEEAFPKVCPYCGNWRQINVKPGEDWQYTGFIPETVNVQNLPAPTALIGNEDISGWSQEMIFQRIRELNDELEESYKAFCDKRLAILADIDRLYKAQGNWRYSF